MLSCFLSVLESDGDRALFAEMYEQYHERMERAALRILKDTYDAEDAVQNAFLKMIHTFISFWRFPVRKGFFGAFT